MTAADGWAGTVNGKPAVGQTAERRRTTVSGGHRGLHRDHRRPQPAALRRGAGRGLRLRADHRPGRRHLGPAERAGRRGSPRPWHRLPLGRVEVPEGRRHRRDPHRPRRGADRPRRQADLHPRHLDRETARVRSASIRQGDDIHRPAGRSAVNELIPGVFLVHALYMRCTCVVRRTEPRKPLARLRSDSTPAGAGNRSVARSPGSLSASWIAGAVHPRHRGDQRQPEPGARAAAARVEPHEPPSARARSASGMPGPRSPTMIAGRPPVEPGGDGDRRSRPAHASARCPPGSTRASASSWSWPRTTSPGVVSSASVSPRSSAAAS